MGDASIAEFNIANAAGLPYFDYGPRPGTSKGREPFPPGTAVWHNSGMFERQGMRHTREDFTASSRSLDLVLADVDKHPRVLPDWMRYARISPGDLAAVVRNRKDDASRHGYLRVLMDGVSTGGGGEEASVNGTMFMLYCYHRNIMEGKDHEQSMQAAINQANSLLAHTPSFYNRERRNLGKATFVAALETPGYTGIYWAGDSQARLFQNGRQTWESLRHRQVDEAMPDIPAEQRRKMYGSNVISSCLGEPHIAKLGYQRLAPLGIRDALVLHSDGVTLTVEQMQQVLKGNRTAQQAAEALVNESLRLGSGDNISCRVITGRPNDEDGQKVMNTQGIGRVVKKWFADAGASFDRVLGLTAKGSKQPDSAHPPTAGAQRHEVARARGREPEVYNGAKISLQEMWNQGYFNYDRQPAVTEPHQVLNNQVVIDLTRRYGTLTQISIPTQILTTAYNEWYKKYVQGQQSDATIYIPFPYDGYRYNVAVDANQLFPLLTTAGSVEKTKDESSHNRAPTRQTSAGRGRETRRRAQEEVYPGTGLDLRELKQGEYFRYDRRPPIEPSRVEDRRIVADLTRRYGRTTYIDVPGAVLREAYDIWYEGCSRSGKWAQREVLVPVLYNKTRYTISLNADMLFYHLSKLQSR